MKEASVPFGAEVRRLRKRAGLSQEQLGEKMGLSRESISQIERGETKHPSDQTLVGLELHLGLTRQRAHELMGAVPRSDSEVIDLLNQLGTIEDRQEMLRMWYQLPLPLRYSMMRVMGVLFVEEGERLLESGRLPSLDREV